MTDLRRRAGWREFLLSPVILSVMVIFWFRALFVSLVYSCIHSFLDSFTTYVRVRTIDGNLARILLDRIACSVLRPKNIMYILHNYFHYTGTVKARSEEDQLHPKQSSSRIRIQFRKHNLIEDHQNGLDDKQL
jgi:hypothetical protein